MRDTVIAGVGTTSFGKFIAALAESGVNQQAR